MGDSEELVVSGAKRLTSYDPTTGAEIWWAGGLPQETVSVPVAGDGLVFASGAALGGRGDDKLDAARTWKFTVEQFDRNGDSQIQRDEMNRGLCFHTATGVAQRQSRFMGCRSEVWTLC